MGSFPPSGSGFESDTRRTGTVTELPASVGNASSQSVDVRTYGAKGDGVTDDTAACQTALNAAGNLPVIFPAGRTFLISFLTPNAGQIISAYGATINQVPGTQNAVIYDIGAPPTVKAGFTLVGGTWVGEGTGVTEFSQSALWLTEWTDVIVKDATAKNFADGGFQFRNCQRVKVIGCSAINCCKSAGRNAINFADYPNGSTNLVQDIQAIGNYVTGCPTAAINLTLGYLDNSSINGQVRAVIADNDVNINGGIYAGIAIETGTNAGIHPAIRSALIANNTISVTGGAGSTWGIEIADSGNSDDQTILQDIAVTGNQITSVGGGIYSQASRIAITGNSVRAAYEPLKLSDHGAALNHTQETEVVGNLFSSAVNPSTGLGLIYITFADHVDIRDNRITCDTGNANTQTVAGIYATSAGFVTIQDNTIRQSPAHGILLNGPVNDYTIAGNRIVNINDGNAANGRAIYLNGSANSHTGTVNEVRENVITDTRGFTTYGVYGAPTGNPLRVLANTIIGTTTPTLGNWTDKRDNIYSAGASAGRATLVAGTVTVNTAEVLAGDNILLTVVTPGGTRGEVQVGTIVAGTSFVINSIQPGTASTLQAADTSTVYWRIDH